MYTENNVVFCRKCQCRLAGELWHGPPCQCVEDEIASFKAKVKSEVGRLAKLGGWAPDFEGEESLLARIPEYGKRAPGFDAGLACALDLIPRNNQKVSASLHGKYRKEVMNQVRAEANDLSWPSDTAWWLYACSFCKEKDGMGQAELLDTIERFTAYSASYILPRARDELAKMKKRFSLADGVPFVTEDGGLQGAYLSGYDWGIQYMPQYGLFFLGTFHDSLGLEKFPWSDKKDEGGRACSGPCWGSFNWMKCASVEELAEAVKVVKEKFRKG